MKKSAILCTLLFSLLLTACGAPAEEEAVKETSYQVLDADKAEVCVISDQAAVEEMNELINSFTSGEATPQGEEPIKPLYTYILCRHSSPLVNKLAFEAYNQKFAPNRTGYDWLSASTENVDQYLADPLCGGDPTIGLFREMLRGIACIEKQENLKRMNRNTPVLFLSGQDDPVGDMGKGVRRAYRSFRRSGVRDVEIRLYQGLRHEILQETGREKVYADVAHWLEAHLPEQ